jgi:cell division protease FtsH
MAQQRDYSEATAQAIDAEVRAIVEAAHDDAYKALTANRKILDTLAKELMERETLNQEEIAVLFKNVKKNAKRKQWLSSKSRPVSKQGPIAIPTKGSTASKQRAAKKAETAKPVRKVATKRTAAKATSTKKSATRSTAKKK